MPQDPTAGKRVLPIRQHTEEELEAVFSGLGKFHISTSNPVDSGPTAIADSPFEEQKIETEAEMSEFEEAETVQMGSETPTVQYTASVTGATIMTATPPLKTQPQVTAGFGRGRRRQKFEGSVPSVPRHFSNFRRACGISRRAGVLDWRECNRSRRA